MAIVLETEYPGRTYAGSASYPQGSFKDETIPGSSDDGTPLQKAWQNDHEGTRQALLSDAAITPSGDADTATSSDVKNAMKVVLGGAGLYQADIDYSATRNDYTKGSDGNLYLCLIDNGPNSTTVNPVGDATGTWIAAAQGLGGQAQTLQDVTASRVLGVTYTNSTQRPIFVVVSYSLTASTDGGATFYVDGVDTASLLIRAGAAGVERGSLSVIVPIGSTYRIDQITLGSVFKWSELR